MSWYLIGKTGCKQNMKPAGMDLKLLWSNKKLSTHFILGGHSLYADPICKLAPLNAPICLILDSNNYKNKPKYIHIILYDDILCPEVCNSVNHLDFLVSKGEGVADIGDEKTYDWHYGYRVNQKTNILEDPTDEMWFKESWKCWIFEKERNSQFDLELEEDEKVITYLENSDYENIGLTHEEWKDAQHEYLTLKWTDNKMIFKVSGWRSEEINFIKGTLQPPVNYKLKWKSMIHEAFKAYKLCYSKAITATIHGRYLQWLRIQ